MIAADSQIGTRAPRTRAGLRLMWLHVVSRRIPAAVVALVACGAVLHVALAWRWEPRTGSGALEIPVLFEAGTAAVIAVTSYSPFGEAERATARWLPWLRLGTVVAMTAVAIGLLAAGAASAADGLTGGILGLVRDAAGMTGIGLLSAAVLGGMLAWAGPIAYLMVTEVALLQAWTTPWTWAARPPDDEGAAICAGAAFMAGLVVIAVRGPRDSVNG